MSRTLLRHGLFLIFLLFGGGLLAQDSGIDDSTGKKRGSLELRAQAGGNLSVRTDFLTETRVPLPGYMIGGSIGFYLADKLIGRGSLLYSERKFAFDNDFNTRYQSFLIPILIEYQYNNFGFFIGRHIDYIMKAEAGTRNLDPFDVIDTVDRFSVGSDLGIGYDILTSAFKLRIEGHLQRSSDIWTTNLSLVFIY